MNMRRICKIWSEFCGLYQNFVCGNPHLCNTSKYNSTQLEEYGLKELFLKNPWRVRRLNVVQMHECSDHEGEPCLH